MVNVSLELDEETARRVKQAARAAGVPQSQWLADLIRQRTALGNDNETLSEHERDLEREPL